MATSLTLDRHPVVGAPEEPLPSFAAFPLIMNNVHIGGSAIGAPVVIKEMLELAAKENVRPWIIKRPMDDVNQAVQDMEKSKARCSSFFKLNICSRD